MNLLLRVRSSRCAFQNRLRVSLRLPIPGFGFAVSQSPRSGFFVEARSGPISLATNRVAAVVKAMKYKDETTAVIQDPTERIIVQSLARLDGTALGVALGLLGGLIVFAATNYLVFKGGEVVGPNLSLLGQFFPGYEVSVAGSFIGFFYGLISGFVLGWLIAFLRNSAVAFYIHVLKVKGSMSAVSDYIDNP